MRNQTSQGQNGKIDRAAAVLGEVDAGDRERGGGQGDELAQALDAIVMGGDDLGEDAFHFSVGGTTTVLVLQVHQPLHFM